MNDRSNGCGNFWVATYTGRKFYIDDPSKEDVCIEDIAHALGNLCRFVGHCKTFYSVAQHSVFVSKMCRPEHALHGLLHDAAEAYLGDLNRPLRELFRLRLDFWGFEVLEQRVFTAIGLRFKLSSPFIPIDVKLVDDRSLATEALCFMYGEGNGWGINAEPYSSLDIRPVGTRRAASMFLERFEELYDGD